MDYGSGQIDFMIGVIVVALTPFISHLIITRIFRSFRSSGQRQKGVAISAIFGLLPVLSFCLPHAYSGSREGSGTYIPDFAYLLLLYGAAAYVYFHFFNMSETSRRIRILVSGSGINETEGLGTSQSYYIDRMLENRLDRLVSLGELTSSGGKYRIGRGLLLLPAKVVALFRHLLFPGDVDQTTPWIKIFSFLFATLGVAVFMNTDLFTKLSAPYAGISLALACGGVGAIAFSLLSSRPCLKNYLLVSSPYLFITFGFVFSNVLPGPDSQTNHFPVFQFFAEALVNGFGAPTWLPITGGVDVGYYHINFFPFLPHRLAGYSIAALFPVSMVTAYKLQLVLGVLLFAYGWYAVIAHLTRSQYAAFWGTICILMGGTGITFHQEQVIATSHLLPWFTFCLLKLREQRLYILPAGTLFGLGLSTHYPQIQLIAMSLVAIAIFLWHRPVLASVFSTAKKFSYWVALLVFLGSLPSLYIWYHGDTLASSIRGMESLQPVSYEEYDRMNKQQVSSALPWYLSQYVHPYHEETNHRTSGHEDLYGMFIGRISLLLCIVGLMFRPALALPVLVLSAAFAELTMGINSHLALPKLLFKSGFPFINVFRQWYHFFPLLNFCLSLLGALGFAVVFKRIYEGPSRFKKYGLIFVIFLNFLDLAYYDQVYMQKFCQEAPPEPMQQYLSEKAGWVATFQYKDRFKLTHDCPKAIPTAPFLTTDYTTTARGVDVERAWACELERQAMVATNIPNVMPRILRQPGGTTNPVTQNVTPWGVNYQVKAPVPSLLVSLVNYSMGASVYIDDQPAEAWRVNSALSGVLLEAGAHNVEFRKPGGWYAIISWIQVMLYSLTALMLMILATTGQCRASTY